MSSTPKIRCLLWDFGDTLCDERFIWASGPEWEQAYQRFDAGFADDWNMGRMDDLEFAQKLTTHIAMTPEDILAHMRERSSHVTFYDYTYAYFRSKPLAQAIVTVNPRLWSEIIVPLYALHEATDAIVTSWEHGTTDKGVLCRVAIDQLACAPGEALLIDNKRENIDAWKAKGGAGYLFTGDEQFKRDVASGLDALASN